MILVLPFSFLLLVLMERTSMLAPDAGSSPFFDVSASSESVGVGAAMAGSVGAGVGGAALVSTGWVRRREAGGGPFLFSSLAVLAASARESENCAASLLLRLLPFSVFSFFFFVSSLYFLFELCLFNLF